LPIVWIARTTSSSASSRGFSSGSSDACPRDLRSQQIARDLDPNGVGRGKGLSPTQRGVAWAGRGRGGDELPVAVDVDQRGADVVEPPEGFQGDVAGMADQNQPAKLGADAVITPRLTIAADPVVDDQVAAVDGDFEPVAVGDADAVVGGLGRVSLHTKLPFVCHAPGPLARSRGRVMLHLILLV